MLGKKKAKKLTLDEMPVLKKAIEILDKREDRLNLGACMVSNNILTGAGQLRWCYRHEPYRGSDVDNGWEFLSDIDTKKFLNVAENWSIISFDQMAVIEPCVVKIFDFPPGTDLVVIDDGDNRYFADSETFAPVLRYCPDEEDE
ncbi:MAG: DUF2185 domain-containing protein [Clostridia bacterium]|nr:DUF2185 domain-containing protein [Clostridia bacterium]